MQTCHLLLLTVACSLLVATGGAIDELRLGRRHSSHQRGGQLLAGRKRALDSAESDDDDDAAKEPDEVSMKAKRVEIAKRNCLTGDLFNPALSLEERRSAERVVLPFVVRCLSHMVGAFKTGHKFPPKCCVLDIFRLFRQCHDDSDGPTGKPSKSPASTTKKPEGDESKSTTTTTPTTTTTTTTKGPDSSATTPAGGSKPIEGKIEKKSSAKEDKAKKEAKKEAMKEAMKEKEKDTKEDDDDV